MAGQTLADVLGPRPQQKPSLERSDTKNKDDSTQKNDSRRVKRKLQCE